MRHVFAKERVYQQGQRRWLARFTRLPTADETKSITDLTVAMQAKETTSHWDALALAPEGSRPLSEMVHTVSALLAFS